MAKKQIRNPRIFVDTPADLKRDYAALCKAADITMSEALKQHMRDMLRKARATGWPAFEQKESA